MTHEPAQEPVAWLAPNGLIMSNTNARCEGINTLGWRPLYAHAPQPAPEPLQATDVMTVYERMRPAAPEPRREPNPDNFSAFDELLTERRDDCTYVAACSPPTTLALLDRIEALEKERDRLRNPTHAMLDALRTGSRADVPSDELCRVRLAALVACVDIELAQKT